MSLLSMAEAANLLEVSRPMYRCSATLESSVRLKLRRAEIAGSPAVQLNSTGN
jgi:hypothetical protein